MLSKQGAGRVLAVIVLAIAAGSLAGRASAVAPENDAFDAAIELTGRSDAASGSNKDATKEPGEPNHADELGGASVWFHWTAPGTGETTIETCGSDFDTLLAAYTGNAVNALTKVASNDDACTFGSSITFTAEEAETYRIAIDGVDGETGLFSLQLRLAPPNDDFADAVVISGDEGSVGGTNDGASLEASEPGDVSNSVWYRWTAPSTGPAAFMTCGRPFDTAAAHSIRRSPSTPGRRSGHWLSSRTATMHATTLQASRGSRRPPARRKASRSVGAAASRATSRSPGIGARSHHFQRPIHRSAGSHAKARR